MSIGMGNAIRELKYHISVVSIDMPEQDVGPALSNLGFIRIG